MTFCVSLLLVEAPAEALLMKSDFSAVKLLCSSTVLQRPCVQSVLRSVINCNYGTQGDSLSDGVKSCDGSCPYVGRSQADGGQVELSQTHPATVSCVFKIKNNPAASS